MAFSARWVGRRPAFFRYAPLPDSDFLLVTESAYVDYNLKAIYSSLAQCGCRGLCELLILARTFGADLPKTVGESALRQALSSLES